VAPFDFQSGQAAAVQSLGWIHREALRASSGAREVIARGAYNYAVCMTQLFRIGFDRLPFATFVDTFVQKRRLAQGQYASIAARVAWAMALVRGLEVAAHQARYGRETLDDAGTKAPIPFLVPPKLEQRCEMLRRRGKELPGQLIRVLTQDFSRSCSQYEWVDPDAKKVIRTDKTRASVSVRAKKKSAANRPKKTGRKLETER
jgi:hypothetical protein